MSHISPRTCACLLLVSLTAAGPMLAQDAPEANRDWPQLDAVGSGGPSTNGAGPPSGDPASWSHWWALNRDGLLPRFPRVFDAGLVAPGTSAGAGQRPSADQRYGEITAQLTAALARERDDELKIAALMALARIGDASPPAGDGVLAVIEPFLADRNQGVREAATVAVGVLGGTQAATRLADLVHDTRAGRALLRRGRVTPRVRAFAAYGLGLVGANARGEGERAFCVHHLTQALAQGDRASQDLQVACVIALGHVPLAVASGSSSEEPVASTRQGQLATLRAILADTRAPRRVRAQVPVALARLVEDLAADLREPVVDALLSELAPGRRASPALVQGIVQALGRLADDDQDARDVAMRAALVAVVEGGGRLQRGLATVALAEAAGRRGSGEPGDAVVAIRKRLVGIVLEGSGDQRRWAVLALGVLERARESLGDPVAAGTRLTLVRRHASTSGPDEQAAFATAFGLMQETDALELLREQAGRGDARRRGAALLALGWMGDTARRDDFYDAMIQTGPASLSREAAIGLALMGDKAAGPALVPTLTASRFLQVRVARIVALASCGDARAVEPLLALLNSRREPARVRAWAAAALGMIATRHPLPWNAGYAEDVVWWDAPPTLLDPEDGRGILDRW